MTTAGAGRRYTLAPRADLAVFHAADAARYAAAGRHALLAAVTAEVFAKVYGDCPSRGFLFDGQPVGGMIFDGEQPHIAVLPQHHGRWATLLAPALDWLFGLRAEMVIRIEPDNPEALAFMERNGWQRLGAAGSTTFRITRQPARKPQASNL